MCTDRLETICASDFICHHQMSLAGEEGPQMNKFEQVSSDHHQMSLIEGGVLELMQ